MARPRSADISVNIPNIIIILIAPRASLTNVGNWNAFKDSSGPRKLFEIAEKNRAEAMAMRTKIGPICECDSIHV